MDVKIPEYLKRTLDNILPAMTAMIPAMLEKNAMNVAPSEADIQQMQNQMKMIKDNLEKMYSEAAAQTLAYKEEYEQKYKKSQELLQMQENLYRAVDESKDQKRELESQLERANREMQQIQLDMNAAEAELRKLGDEMQSAIKKKREKQEKLEKWCWVPGYGLYLGIDMLTDDLDAQIKGKEAKRQQVKRLLDEKYHMKNQSAEELNAIGSRIENQEKQISENNTNILQITEELRKTKYQIVCLEDLSRQLQDLNSKLCVGKSSPDMLMEVMNMLEGIGEAF